MKECPKCGTLYTDVTLAYCLSDGTPLIVQITGEKTEKFTNADIVTEELSQTDFTANTEAETVVKTNVTNIPTKETVVKTNQSKTKNGVSPIWIIATFGLLGIILIGGVSFWVFSDNFFTVNTVTNETNSNSNSAFENSQINTSNENINISENPITNQKPTPKPIQTSTPKPNTYRVANVRSNDVLNIRPKPGNLKVIVGKIPSNGKGIKIIGGSKKVGKSRWILISYKGKKGWINSKFIRKE